MELSHDPVHEAPLPSASIVLLRDGDRGLEVFLLRRHGSSSAFGGAHVFPGGKVDAADRELDAGRHLDLVPSLLPGHLGEPELPLPDAIGLYVAAVRELFEETGVLLAASDTDAQAPCRLSGLLQGGHSFHTALHRLDLRLQTTELAPWSRWITPLIPNFSRRRFDTRFFLAAMPTDQQAGHDNQEAVDSTWLTPRAALQAYWDHLVRGYHLDAVGAPVAPLDAARVTAFLAEVEAADEVVAEATGIGHEVHLCSPSIAGAALALDGTLVHLSAHALP